VPAAEDALEYPHHVPGSDDLWAVRSASQTMKVALSSPVCWGIVVSPLAPYNVSS
jgi:hypothetical protein